MPRIQTVLQRVRVSLPFTHRPSIRHWDLSFDGPPLLLMDEARELALKHPHTPSNADGRNVPPVHKHIRVTSADVKRKGDLAAIK